MTKNFNKEERESEHGVGAPEVPQLNMTMLQEKASLDHWCAAAPEASIGGGATVGVYADERMARFGAEVEDTPAESDERKQEAASTAAIVASQLASEAKADRSGPRTSCRWWIAYVRQFGGRPTSDDMAGDDNRRVWDWCSAHPDSPVAKTPN